jgi:hypothetical protein
LVPGPPDDKNTGRGRQPHHIPGAGVHDAAGGLWPFAARSLKTRFHSHAWRVGVGLAVAIPVVAGWPALFLPVQAEYAGGNWLKIAVPWWVLVGALGAEMLMARLTADR